MQLQAQHIARYESVSFLDAKAQINDQPRPLHLVSQKVFVNDLLVSLQRASLDSALHYAELVRLTELTELFDCGDPVSYIYFPTTAIVSLLYVKGDGATTEMAVVGREGMIGTWWSTNDRAFCRAVVQVGGYTYRINVQDLHEAISQGGSLPQLLMCYTNAQLAALAHKVVGSKRTPVTKVLAQWLLDRIDRSTANELKVTHELIASMLGVRRETVTEAMGKLQSNGTVQCRRGKVIILDRNALRRSAGESHCDDSIGMPRYVLNKA